MRDETTGRQTEGASAALPLYERAVAIDPKFRDALTNRGGVLCALGRYDEATVPPRAALKLDPDDEVAWHTLAEAQEAQGLPEAVASLGRFIELAASMPQWASPSRGQEIVSPDCRGTAPVRPRGGDRGGMRCTVMGPRSSGCSPPALSSWQGRVPTSRSSPRSRWSTGARSGRTTPGTPQSGDR